MKKCRIILLTAILIFMLTCSVLAGEETEFTDEKYIEHCEEVVLLTELEIISGFPDSTFRPHHLITRQEVAKIMTFLKTNAVPPVEEDIFNDVQGLWGENYINFCAREGIVSAKENTPFRPEETISGRELTKMLLLVLGHDGTTYEGETWAEAVDADGEKFGIYNGFDGDRAAYISRENAVLLIYNALLNPVVKSDENGTITHIVDDMMNPLVLIHYRFGVVAVSGIVESNENYSLVSGTVSESNSIRISGFKKTFLVSEIVANDNDLLGRKIDFYAYLGGETHRGVGVPIIAADEIAIDLNTPQDLQWLIYHDVIQYGYETKYFLDFVSVSKEILSDENSDFDILAIDHNGDCVLDIVLLSSR